MTLPQILELFMAEDGSLLWERERVQWKIGCNSFFFHPQDHDQIGESWGDINPILL